MRAIGLAAICGAALLAGCGSGDGGETETPREVRSIAIASEYQKRLLALDDVNRGLALKRAIQDSGQRCRRVEANAYQEDYQALHMWRARCDDSGDWALFIAPNGDVQVRPCADAAQLGLPGCRFDEASDAPPGAT